MTSNARESQLVLILDDDLLVTEGLAAGLEREQRTIITCNDLESAELIVQRLRPSHIVSDVRLTGQFAFEGLQFIRFAKQYSPESRVILMTGDAPEALQLEAAERGAVAFLQKPFEIKELDTILDMLSCSALSSAANGASVIRMPLMDHIVKGNALQPLFQPIVSLGPERQALGFEALARYRGNFLLRNPQMLFEYAERKQRVADLDLACVSQALRAGAPLTQKASLFMNIHPAVLTEGRALRDVLVRDAGRYGVGLDKIVLEITEQGSIADERSVFESIAEMRDLGLRFALDDVGVAYSHLPFMDKIHPAFLKISQHFGTAFETDSTKMKIVMNLQSLANDFGCHLILEGIEHRETADIATSLGIKYGQGFLFGHPAEVESFSALQP